MNICDHLTVLDYGRVIANGLPNEVRAHPEVIRAYLGGVVA
jgi:branched-chain amino acid transport system ATP-binding protein